MSAATKPVFNGAPARTLRDPSLTPVDHRVLGAIALHDRFNSNGQGCWAGNARLAQVAGCHPNSVPRSITKLIGKGYVRDLAAEPGQRRTKRRQLVVIYTEEDRRFFEARDDAGRQKINQLVNKKINQALLTKDQIEDLAQKRSARQPNNAAHDLDKGRPSSTLIGLTTQALSKQDRARMELALTLGEGDIAKGFRKLKAIPDAAPRAQTTGLT